MRVITGTARGRRLKEPVGLETRPTADRVKEGIFSSIQFELEGRRENLSLTGFSDRATVVQGDYLAFLTRCRETFDVIFLDPPYGSGMLEKALETITTIDIVSENGIIVCENGSTVGWPAVRAPYRLQKEYRYGKIRTALYRRQAD